MKLKTNIIVLSFFLLTLSCGETPQTKRTIQEGGLVTAFQTELDQLDQSVISAIDSATVLFQEFAGSANSLEKKDSLFFPYFTFYNIGCELLLQEESSLVNHYGFRKKNRNGKDIIEPSFSSYLNENIIQYLSESMQEFCRQQLKEFDDSNDVATIAKNTLWWEEFNRQNPDFFLREMSLYHYKNWHLTNLLKGRDGHVVFDEDEVLLEEVRKVYHRVISDYPASNTANTITDFLAILEINDFRKTAESDAFVEGL